MVMHEDNLRYLCSFGGGEGRGAFLSFTIDRLDCSSSQTEFFLVNPLSSFLSFFWGGGLHLQKVVLSFFGEPFKATMHGRTALRLGITAHRLSNNVTFYTNNLASTTPGWPSHASGEHRPLMLMLPWYGSRPQAIAKYCDIYFRTGLDVLVVESEVS